MYLLVYILLCGKKPLNFWVRINLLLRKKPKLPNDVAKNMRNSEMSGV